MYATPICPFPTDSKTNFFSPSILLSSKNLFILGDFNCHHLLWDSGGTSDPHEEGVFDSIISSNLLPLNNLDILTLLHRSSADISLLRPLLLYLAHGRCFRTWVLITDQFFYLSLSLRSFAPTSVPLSSIFRKLAGMTLPCTLTLTVLLQKNTRFFPFLCCCSLFLSGTECGQIFYSFWPHQTPS